MTRIVPAEPVSGAACKVAKSAAVVRTKRARRNMTSSRMQSIDLKCSLLINYMRAIMLAAEHMRSMHSTPPPPHVQRSGEAQGPPRTHTLMTQSLPSSEAATPTYPYRFPYYYRTAATPTPTPTTPTR